MSSPAFEQLERFPLHLYDSAIEDTMAVARATRVGKEAVDICIANQRQARQLRSLGLGGLNSSVEVEPVDEITAIDGQLALLE